MKEFKGWVGRKFGNLTVLSETGTIDRGSCLCSCECGNEIRTKKALLRSGKVRSCGCLSKDRPSGARQKQDLKGRKIGRLLVRRKGSTIENRDKYFCVCDCGNMKWVDYGSLVAGNVNSCGCLRQEMYDKKRKPLDVGDRFGRLVVLEIYKDGPAIMCKCQCDCGEITHVRKTNLVREGNGTRSCGCWQIEISREKNTIHGLGKDKLYRVCWQARDRVLNKRTGAEDYFQLGFEPEWQEDLLLMASELRPLYSRCVELYGKKYTTIERIDNTKGYLRGNVTFVSTKQQHDNKSPHSHQSCFSAKNIKTGERYCSNNIRHFAKKFNLSGSEISKVLHGIRETHKDFTFHLLGAKCYRDGTKIEGKWRQCISKWETLT